MPKPVNIAVLGAGLIGVRHCGAMMEAADVSLCAICDPSEASKDIAQRFDVPHFENLQALIASDLAEGIIIATPNQLHVENGLDCVAAGLPFLVEKPLSSDVVSGARLVDAADHANVAMLVGHHRRYNPIVVAAKAALEAQELGLINTVQAQFWLYKPEDYFRTSWRGAAGGGPLAINFIHDIDLLHHFCGPVSHVQAMEGARRRETGGEENIVLLMRFASGAVGTASISDSTVAPWSWEMTSGENPAYAATGQASYHIGGSAASLSVPDLRIWRHQGAKSWWSPMEPERLAVESSDPLILQIEHFAQVILGKETPRVRGEDGLAALRVVEAVKRAVLSGAREEV